MFLAVWRRAKKEFCNFSRCFLCYEEVLKIVFSIFHTFSTVWWASQNIFWIYFSIFETFLKRFWNQCFLLTAGCTLCSSISSSKSSFITLAKNDIIWPYFHMGRFFFGDVEPLSFLLTYFRCDFLSYFVRFLDLLAARGPPCCGWRWTRTRASQKKSFQFSWFSSIFANYKRSVLSCTNRFFYVKFIVFS